ncbi:hypothetical protein A2U01_0105255, partial [Trifolium medium]|nr:hypothetical protein [Trifolium medium]
MGGWDVGREPQTGWEDSGEWFEVRPRGRKEPRHTDRGFDRFEARSRHKSGSTHHPWQARCYN